VAHNDDVVAPGAGFGDHPHQDVEIVTWVLGGSLTHRDSTGGRQQRVHAGSVQALSAGTGVVHSEINAGDQPLRFVQMWVLPGEQRVEPRYEQAAVDPVRLAGGWVTVASGIPGDAATAAVSIAQRHVALRVVRLLPGDHAAVPAAPYVHLDAAVGSANLEGVGRLHTGDAVRLTRSEPRRVTAVERAELLAWEMHAIA